MDKKNWNYSNVRRSAWRTAFGKGFKPWFFLFSVIFIYSFFGIAGSAQTDIINMVDKVLGLENERRLENTDVLKEYVIDSGIAEKIPLLSEKQALGFVDGLTRGSTWLIQILGINSGYLKRNSGEVIVFLLIAAVLSAIVRFFLQNVFLIGRNRYVLENRIQKDVKVKRIFAPFHKENILKLIRVTICYYFTVILWMLTIVGGAVKYYQYSMVPYIIAENPELNWKTAKRISAEMTKGYKWKLFLTDMSAIYLVVIRLIPGLGILVGLPVENQLNAEKYFRLRNRVIKDDGRLFEKINARETSCLIFNERAFDRVDSLSGVISGGDMEKGYITAEGADIYILHDIAIEIPYVKGRKKEYLFTDYTIMFFIFSFIGWIWEVGLHMVQKHEFVNRGTLYGPWLPIYGVGGIMIIFCLSRFRNDWFKLFLMSMLLCGVVEYLTSFLLDIINNTHYWSYKSKFMNLNGRICISGLVAFGLGGLFGVYIGGPRIRAFMHEMPRRRQIVICTVLLTFFAADLICCALFGFNTGKGVGGTY